MADTTLKISKYPGLSIEICFTASFLENILLEGGTHYTYRIKGKVIFTVILNCLSISCEDIFIGIFMILAF